MRGEKKSWKLPPRLSERYIYIYTHMCVYVCMESIYIYIYFDIYTFFLCASTILYLFAEYVFAPTCLTSLVSLACQEEPCLIRVPNAQSKRSHLQDLHAIFFNPLFGDHDLKFETHSRYKRDPHAMHQIETYLRNIFPVFSQCYSRGFQPVLFSLVLIQLVIDVHSPASVAQRPS